MNVYGTPNRFPITVHQAGNILCSVSAGNKIQDMVEGVRALPSELVVIAVEEPWLTTVTTIVIAIAIATSIADGL